MSPVRFELQNFYPRGNFFEFDNKYIIRCLLLKYRLIFFTCLSVFDSPKGSSNTFKARKKYQPVCQKKAPDNI